MSAMLRATAVCWRQPCWVMNLALTNAWPATHVPCSPCSPMQYRTLPQRPRAASTRRSHARPFALPVATRVRHMERCHHTSRLIFAEQHNEPRGGDGLAPFAGLGCCPALHQGQLGTREEEQTKPRISTATIQRQRRTTTNAATQEYEPTASIQCRWRSFTHTGSSSLKWAFFFFTLPVGLPCSSLIATSYLNGCVQGPCV